MNRMTIRVALMAMGVFASPLAHASGVAITEFNGTDDNVSYGDSLPNSDLTASEFVTESAAYGINAPVITFESATVGSPSPQVIAPGVSVSFVTAYTGISDDNGDSQQGFDTTNPGSNYLNLAIVNGTSTDASATFTFSTPIVSFGAYITSLDDSAGNTFTIEFNNGTAQSLGFVGPDDLGYSAQFIGFLDPTATSPITSVTIHDNNPDYFYSIGIDDVHYAFVPEPSTWGGLVALGFLAALGLRRRLASGLC